MCGMAYNALGILQYLARDYYVIYKEANVLILFRDPDQWLIWLAIGLGYTGYIGITYLAPLMVDAFGMSEAVATALSTVTNHGVGLVALLIAGVLATRFRAAHDDSRYCGSPNPLSMEGC